MLLWRKPFRKVVTVGLGDSRGFSHLDELWLGLQASSITPSPKRVGLVESLLGDTGSFSARPCEPCPSKWPVDKHLSWLQEIFCWYHPIGCTASEASHLSCTVSVRDRSPLHAAEYLKT